MRLKGMSLQWALKHVRKEGDTDLFPQPFEFEVIKKYWPDVLKELESIEINRHEWQGPRRLMVPKSEFGFRTVCQLDPEDSILFAALVREIGSKIERKRSPPSDKSVFSYRFNPAVDGAPLCRKHRLGKFLEIILVSLRRISMRVGHGHH